MPSIRSTFRPQDELDVSDVEAAYLDRIHRVVHTQATTEEGARRAALRQAAATEKE